MFYKSQGVKVFIQAVQERTTPSLPKLSSPAEVDGDSP
jgi:hypothetical protein